MTSGDAKWRRRRRDRRVLVASGLPILCAFGWALHLSREAARPPLAIDFSQPQILFGLKGFSGPEAWGRWTEGGEAALILGAPLPPRFDLVLEAKAFGPNAGAPLEIRAGGVVRTLVLGTGLTNERVPFRDVAPSRTLVFRIPHPVSPREMGLGEDDRRLGIAVSRLALTVPRNGE
jgi:hypothetical protein